MIRFEDYKEGRIHFIGVGGCSMSGLAQILNNLGYQVSGSDLNDSPFMQTLREQNIPVKLGHDAAYVQGAALVIYSAAIKPSNVEFAYAKEHGIPMLERSVLLGQVSRGYQKSICIAGCHGKTTITSMLALISNDAHIDPTVHVGGMVDFLSGGVRLGKEDCFITEACEYVRSFLTLHPSHIVINNIDDDHLDCYRDIDEIIDTFVQFVSLLPENGVLFANPDDENTQKALSRVNCNVITYSIQGNGQYNAANVAYDELGNPEFDIIKEGKTLGHIVLHVPGLHNVQNALAACVVAYEAMGISFEESAKALLHYHLAGRRFELVGERDGVKIFHDYAHHPTEIKACLDAASNYPHKKLYVLFQCNSFTRARTLRKKYGLAFEKADVVMVPNLYPGRDIDTGDIHATDLVDEINAHSHNALYLPTFQDIKEYLLKNWQSGDIVVTLGSGDVYKQQMILLEK